MNFAGFAQDSIDDKRRGQRQIGFGKGSGLGNDVPGDCIGDALRSDGAQLILHGSNRWLESDV
ncbi:MAG: hypothetical protein ACK6D7_17995, partial [Acidobacteriota bacterium]